MIDTRHEIKEVRRDLDRLRRDFEAWKRAKPHSSGTRREHPERSGFRSKFQSAVADQLHRQNEFFRIEKRVSAMEKRVTELEQLCGVDVPIN